MSTEENKACGRRFVEEIINKGNIAVAPELVAEENKVASYNVWRGTHQGIFLGIPPTGKQVTVSSTVFDYFVDGKLKESRILMNVMGLMQQLGVVPSPGQAG